MYVKRSLVEELSITDTTIVPTDPDFTESTTELTTFSTASSDGTTTITSPGGGDDEEKKWFLPVVISLSCLLLVVIVVASVVIYRKWRCFGLPLPWSRRKVHLAHPMKKIADSVRSSISSTFSSSLGTIVRGKEVNKQFRKYAVRLADIKMQVRNVDFDGDTRGRDLHWIGERDFSGEFEAVKRADLKDLPVTAALKSENVMRNRFSNVLPYDKSRVVLTTAGALGNDYVNASYVSGYRREMEFICTQGPLKHTVTDFWRMCWETKAAAIVMLTKCYEKDQEKCYPYWPTGNTGYSVFGDLKVTLERKTTWRLKGSSQGPDEDLGELSRKDHLWQVSELTMEKDGERYSHNIIHIVFLSWPDFGIINPPEVLVSFVKHVQRLVKSREQTDVITANNNDSRGPIVVHCSAGVGRSGVFIAIDQIIQQLKELMENPTAARNESVNVFEMVAKMRRYRMGMVQNIQQYILIYKCLHIIVRGAINGKEIEEPSMVGNEVIQGSDWGLIEASMV